MSICETKNNKRMLIEPVIWAVSDVLHIRPEWLGDQWFGLLDEIELGALYERAKPLRKVVEPRHVIAVTLITEMERRLAYLRRYRLVCGIETPPRMPRLIGKPSLDLLGEIPNLKPRPSGKVSHHKRMLFPSPGHFFLAFDGSAPVSMARIASGRVKDSFCLSIQASSAASWEGCRRTPMRVPLTGERFHRGVVLSLLDLIMTLCYHKDEPRGRVQSSRSTLTPTKG
jgi:hypothetical protein